MCLLSSIFIIFFNAFIVQYIQKSKMAELDKVLQEVKAEHLLPVLHATGIWSPELLVSKEIYKFPNSVLSNRELRTTLQVQSL